MMDMKTIRISGVKSPFVKSVAGFQVILRIIQHTGVFIIRAKSQQWDLQSIIRRSIRKRLTSNDADNYGDLQTLERDHTLDVVSSSSHFVAQRKQLKFYIYCFYLIGIVALYNTDEKTIKWLCPFLKIRVNIFSENVFISGLTWLVVTQFYWSTLGVNQL